MNAPVAVVTGAARGIGAATVDRLVASGWRVGALDIGHDDPTLDYPMGTVSELEAVASRHDGRVIPLVADVRDQRAVDTAVHTTVATFGRLDAAIADAGVIAGGRNAWETTEAEWAIQLDVNLTGVWHLANATIPTILATEPLPEAQRTFVAVSSSAGLRARRRLAAYSASKFGVIGLVTAMAAELGPEGITANVVCPGSTDTPLLTESARIYGLDDPSAFTVHHVLDRLVEPTDVAATIAYLSSAAASAITGAVIPVDAGMGIE
ncbi:MAG: SDR family oxidoreductase [Actinobacteria bacterium]|nr:SDR family oxidoreductase [Actinomycetota bacterium]